MVLFSKQAEEKYTYNLIDLKDHTHVIKTWGVERKGEMKGFPHQKFIGLIFYFFGDVPANIKTECIELGGWSCIIAESDLINVKAPGSNHDKLC